jgi:hypothetical protein
MTDLWPIFYSIVAICITYYEVQKLKAGKDESDK